MVELFCILIAVLIKSCKIVYVRLYAYIHIHAQMKKLTSCYELKFLLY